MTQISELIKDFIALNEACRPLELCKKFYADDVLMLSNGSIYAETMQQAHDKQKAFVDQVTASEVKLVAQRIDGDKAELVFHYKMTNSKSESMEFGGKHRQWWQGDKIIKEEYSSVTLTDLQDYAD